MCLTLALPPGAARRLRLRKLAWVSGVRRHGAISRRRQHQAAMKALCLELRRQDIPCQWKACLEVDAEKGLHFHIFILAEAKHRSPCAVLNHNSQHWLNVMMQKRGLTYYIAPPHNLIHRNREGKRLNYATLAGEKLADCIVWISYLVKRRSKLDSMTHIYFSSRPGRRVKALA